jgi:hypothetical protein
MNDASGNLEACLGLCRDTDRGVKILRLLTHVNTRQFFWVYDPLGSNT